MVMVEVNEMGVTNRIGDIHQIQDQNRRGCKVIEKSYYYTPACVCLWCIIISQSLGTSYSDSNSTNAFSEQLSSPAATLAGCLNL